MVRHRTLTPLCAGSNPATPAKYDPLAQSVEHLTFNQGVPSSNLGWITNKSDERGHLGRPTFFVVNKDCNGIQDGKNGRVEKAEGLV